jgi:outer membrane protein OmpA-like peptidoglycan-associated protein
MIFLWMAWKNKWLDIISYLVDFLGSFKFFVFIKEIVMKVSNWFFCSWIAIVFLAGCATQKTETPKPSVTFNDDEANAKAGFRIKETPRGAALTFNDQLLFDTGKSDLSTRSFNILDRIVALAKEKDMKEIEISGHTDNQGSESINQKLSEQRAAAVKDALVSRGLRVERIKAAGYGFSKPEASNDTAQGRALNRRAEVLFVNFTKKNLGGEKVEQGFNSDVAKVFDGLKEFGKKTFKAVTDIFSK